jgi:hypothetical protein
MNRRGIIVGATALALAGLLTIGGLVLRGHAEFAETYTTQQLSQEKISFKPADQLSSEEIAFTEARTGCVVTYAGQPLTTGRQAECYANEYLGGHLTYLATRLGMESVAYVDGLTYSELGAVQADLRAKIAEAEAQNDPALAALEDELAAVTTVRTKTFEGAMLRSALLSVYGFSVLGEKATEAYVAAFIAAAVLAGLTVIAAAYAVVRGSSRAAAGRTARPAKRATPA